MKDPDPLFNRGAGPEGLKVIPLLRYVATYQILTRRRSIRLCVLRVSNIEVAKRCRGGIYAIAKGGSAGTPLVGANHA